MSKPRRIIYPPVWLIIGLVVIFVLKEFVPLTHFGGTLATGIGSVVILVGLALLVQAGGLFKAAETDMIPFQNVTALVTTGIYKLTRNPMYLGMALVLFGTSLTVGALAGVFVAPVFMVIIEVRFIRPEEEMLRGIFGEEFAAYCQQVRRWL